MLMSTCCCSISISISISISRSRLQAKDSFRYHPWRAPGFAPVVAVCGMAGGASHPGTGAGVFTTTPWAKQGDLVPCVACP